MKDELISACRDAITKGTGVYLTMKKFPPGFPVGVPISGSMFRFNPHRVMEWVRGQGV